MLGTDIEAVRELAREGRLRLTRGLTGDPVVPTKDVDRLLAEQAGAVPP